MHSRSGFTLIELLVVIAIIAILSVVVVLTLNPAATLQQARDQNRLSDIDTLTHAMSLTQTDANPISLGTSSVVYVSLPDPAATTAAGNACTSLGLPILPVGYTYHCAGPNYYRKTDGTGWLGVNFSGYSVGSLMGQLPIDPINASSSRLYYTYTTNGTQFEITSIMESQKYGAGGTNDVISGDGGPLASVYEKGSKLGLEPLDYGNPSLVGLWTFDEGTGGVSGVTQAYDYSGGNNAGTWYGTATGTSGYYSPGKVGSWAGTFDGGTNYASTSDNPSLNVTNAFTLTAWVNTVSAATYRPVVTKYFLSTYAYGYDIAVSAAHAAQCDVRSGTNGFSPNTLSPTGVDDGTWHFIACTFNGSQIISYKDGVAGTPTSWTYPSATSSASFQIGARLSGGAAYFPGLIDDVHIYNRALSATQIAAMYAGGK